MNVALHDADSTRFPNLALLKLSAAYKQQGHSVSIYEEGKRYDKIVSSKVFTFTSHPVMPEGTIFGGYGYSSEAKLPEWVEHICPDYALYGLNYSLGFLTRGCIRKCSHCFVPKREGKLRAHADIEEFLKHNEVVLMDNNVLAHDHGISQIEKMARLGIKVDFNQGLDARLIDAPVAKLLSSLKWRHPVRLACDSLGQMDSVVRAVTLLRWYNVTPRKYFCYVLIKDVDDALERIKMLKGMYVDPFAQPYLDAAGTPPSKEQKQLARWCNHKAAFAKSTFEEYKKQQGKKI